MLLALLQVSLGQLLGHATGVSRVVLLLLLLFSLLSWAIIIQKFGQFRAARAADGRFRRMFQKAQGLEAVALASEQFPSSPLVTVFEYGYEELDRQVRTRGQMGSQMAVERSLQIGTGEATARLEANLNWLATTATVTPFIGLFGTVLGIIDAFQGLGNAGSASLRAVAPGISEALIATAMGLAAAIPAAIAFNYFGNAVRELGGRMEDFALEFLNLAERGHDLPAAFSTPVRTPRTPEAR